MTHDEMTPKSGINQGLPGIADDLTDWMNRVTLGATGARPGLSNAAVLVRDPRQISWWHRVWARITRRKARTYQDYLDAGWIQIGALKDGE